MNDYVELLLGITAAGVGGELFVRGAVGLARWLRIPAGIIGATIAAFATSSPELSVAVNSALAGKPQIALGDAIGSNVVNIALILGVSLVFSQIVAPRDSVRRDFPVAIGAPLLTAILAIDGEISRIDGAIMLAVFIVWLAAVVQEARRQRSKAPEVLGAAKRLPIILTLVAGLVMLIGAGRLFVDGAVGIAASYGVSDLVIGATVVSIGTSLPELATVIISKFRGHEEVGLGAVLGSNIFNSFWIVSITALVSPIRELPQHELAVGLGFGLLTAMLTFPGKNSVIARWRGSLLLVLYIAYIATILHQ